MNKIIATFISIIIATVITGCSSNLYKEASSSAQHATLISKKGNQKYLGISLRQVYILEINGQGVDTMWKGPAATRFINPGVTSVHVESMSQGKNLTSYALLQFMAKAGSTYVLESESHIQSTTFTVREDGREIVRVVSPRTPKPPSQPVLYLPIFI